MNTDLSELRQRYRTRRQTLGDQFFAEGGLKRLTHGLKVNADETLRALWSSKPWPKGSSLLAVGGYGRGELFPGSDIDILVLLPSNQKFKAAAETRATEFIGNCWDLGLEIGHAIRTVDDCIVEAIQDVTVQTSLLESRWLAGSRLGLSQLEQRLIEVRDPQAFFQAKRMEMRQRHAKFEDTPYSLEPNLKESPGGLRDLQVILWMTRAAGLGSSWNELVANKVISRQDARTFISLDTFIKTARARLHLLAKRREDRIVFDLQAPLARSFGITAPSDRRASEQFMERYYRRAKQITQANTLLMLGLEERLFPQTDGQLEPLDEEFSVRRELLDINRKDLFDRDPSAILRAFIRLAENESLHGMTGQTLLAMWRAKDKLNAQFRADPKNRALFMQFMRQPRGITHELRRMNQWSILGGYLPAFRRIVGRMQHDLFHIYTVDQHILMVIRNLRRFAIEEHAHEYPLCSELMGHFDKPWLLYLAALFHDIAKGRGGDHSKLGRVDARRFATQHGLTKPETQLLVFLVEHHLTMSHVAQKQDLSDPATIESFAKTIGSAYSLNALYLLTVADIRGTSPKVWNNWKGKLLEELYRKTRKYLSGDSINTLGIIDQNQQEAKAKLALYGLLEDSYAEFWAQMQPVWFSSNDPQDIAWQTRALYRQTHSSKPIVRARLSSFGEGFQVVVYVRDEPELFARICGYFDSHNFSILDAKVHTTEHHYALDSFVVSAPDFADRYRDILQMVETELAERIESRTPLGPSVKARQSRRSRYFPVTPRLDLRPDERSQRYLLTVSASDRTGLLYGLARTMAHHQVNLHMARINTLGERIEDTFLIDGPMLQNQRQQLAFEEDLLKVLNSP